MIPHDLNATQRIDAAFEAVDKGSDLCAIYAVFNRATASVIDELHAHAAEMDDGVSLKQVERKIISICHRRASELMASLKMGGAP
jgi:hypothetical protein